MGEVERMCTDVLMLRGGMGFKPPRWLVAGDVVRIEIDGIGAIENTFR